MVTLEDCDRGQIKCCEGGIWRVVLKDASELNSASEEAHVHARVEHYRWSKLMSITYGFTMTVIHDTYRRTSRSKYARSIVTVEFTDAMLNGTEESAYPRI